MLEFLASIISQQIALITALIVAGMTGIVAAHGWTWTTAIFAGVAIIVLAVGWLALAFWTWVFRNSGRKGTN